MKGAGLSFPINNGINYLNYEVPSEGYLFSLGRDLFVSSNEIVKVLILL